MALITTKEEFEKYVNEGRNYGKKNPFEGTEYADMWMNNPYRNLYYDASFWDNIGLSNKSKDANAEYERLYNEYIAGIYDLQQQNAYNSESSKVQRMKEAGLNPDILGLSGSSESSDFTPPNAGPNSALNGQSPALPILQNMGSILSFALNAYQGITKTLIDVDTADIERFSSLTDKAKPFVTQSFAEAFLNGYTPEISVASGSNAFARQFSSRRNQKRALSAFEHLFYSGDYELQRKALHNASGKFDDEIKFNARQYFSDNYSVQNFIKTMVDLSVEEFKISKQSNINLKSKEALLNKFRKESIEKMIDSYRKSGGHDILTGLLLAGTLESVGLSSIGNPFTFVSVGSDKAGKGISNGVYKGWNKVKGLLGEFF